MDDTIAQFTAITSADPQRARQYLTLTDNNLEQAIQLYFDSDGADMGAAVPQASAPRPVVGSARSGYTENQDGTVTIDSDDEMDDDGGATPSARPIPASAYEDDEAMARRLQEEAYGAGGPPGEEVRAPMARTAETLVGPNVQWGAANDDDEMRAAIAEQIANRQRRAAARPGIFNQRAEPSVWDEDNEDPEIRRRNLARATGGASETSSKSNLLAELFRPPIDLISPLSWSDARDEGKENEKWILVNIQDPSIFDCQVLNRDIWKNPTVRDTVNENFIFMQYTKNDQRAGQYVNYYFHDRDNEEAYPHIAIVDPRTGEQVKVWSGSPAPSVEQFLQDIHEFLDRYSLKAFAKNPVANRKPDKKTKDVERMTEEEMLEMALQNSLSNGKSAERTHSDPDALTKSETNGKGKASAEQMDVTDMGTSQDGQPEASSTAAEPSPFSLIAADRPHTEPTDPATSTRIQFRYSGGRQVRRFALSEQVRRIYEWLKSSPVDEKHGVDFELIFMGRNLIDSLDQTVEEAGLKNGSVMVEFTEE